MDRYFKRLAATLFPITGLSDNLFQFRVLKVREKIPNDSFKPIRMQRWADSLWRKVLKCPIYPISKLNQPAFLIPENYKPNETIEIEGVPDQIYHIDMSENVIQVLITDANELEREMICRIIERVITDRLMNFKSELWKEQWTLFFNQSPENEKNPNDIVNAYRGFKFGVVIVNNEPYLAIDVRTRYLGRKALSKYLINDRKEILKKHLDLDLDIEDRASFIRDNGFIKISCRYTGDADGIVENTTFDKTNITIFQYYREKYPNIKINPNEKVVFVQDSGKDFSIPVPESRLFPIFTTDYEGIKNCSIKSQLTPRIRMNKIKKFFKYLVGLSYGKNALKIKNNPLIQERTVFIPPRLEFGSPKFLDPFPNGIPAIFNKSFDSGISSFGSKKIVQLYNAGPYHNEIIPPIIILYPGSVKRPIRETLIENLRTEIELQTGQKIIIQKQRQYRIGHGENMGSSLIELAVEEINNQNRPLLLIILWNRFYKSVHGELKDNIKQLFSQCATEKTINLICNMNNPQRAKSRLRNLALGILTEVGVIPWVLADPLNYDLYVGIDVLYGHICYHFIYGQGGRNMEIEFGHTIKRGHTKEAIKSSEIHNKILKKVKEISRNKIKIKSIVIHRDGRWYQSESAGLDSAMKTLKKNKFIDEDAYSIVVEIHKTHKPIRLFTKLEVDPFFQNPLPGTYLILDEKNAIINTTGRPGEWDTPYGRTARTIMLKIVEPEDFNNITEILEDAYRLTHLNWNAPDIEISLPVTIRWADEALRETYRSSSDEDNESDDLVEKKNNIEERVLITDE